MQVLTHVGMYCADINLKIVLRTLNIERTLRSEIRKGGFSPSEFQ